MLNSSSILFSPEKPGPLGQAKDIWLCLRVFCLKSQIPSTKKQTSSKLQAPNLKKILKFVVLNFGHCDLFDICYLSFGI